MTFEQHQVGLRERSTGWSLTYVMIWWYSYDIRMMSTVNPDIFSGKFGCQWHEICQKNYLDRIFRQKKITHSKCVIYDYFYSQYNNIIASKLVVWVNLGNNLTECVEYQQQQSKITLGVWKFCIFSTVGALVVVTV